METGAIHAPFMPDFIVAGAPRCGTTTIYHALEAHPEIFMSPVKEPHYFAMDDIQADAFRAPIKRSLASFNFRAYLAKAHRPFLHRWYVHDTASYQALFRDAEGFVRRGEASTSYLWAPGAAARIKERLPGAKIIIPLRNPVDRAYSHYLMERRMRLTKMSFTEHLAVDLAHPNPRWGATPMYVETGMYARHLSRFLAAFDRSQLFVCLMEDLVSGLVPLVKSIYTFLGVNRVFKPDAGLHFQRAALPRSRIASTLAGVAASQHRFLPGPGGPFRNLLKRALFTSSVRTPMRDEDRQTLLRLFREDTLRLQDILKRDLSAWLR